MALVTGLHHVCMKCTSQEDYDKVAAFYTGTLGLPIVRQWAGGLMVGAGSSVIEFFRNGEAPLPTGVIRHFALATDSVDACVRAVEAAGYSFFDGPRDAVIPSDPPYPIRVAFCHGPLGEEIEFFEER